jgi:hypothetical protein
MGDNSCFDTPLEQYGINKSEVGVDRPRDTQYSKYEGGMNEWMNEWVKNGETSIWPAWLDHNMLLPLDGRWQVEPVRVSQFLFRFNF